MVLTVHEYVGDGFGLPAFLLTLLGGMLFGVALFAWFARTELGEKARRLYRDASTGQRVAVAVVPLVALMYAAVTADIPLLLLVVLLSASFSYQQSKFATAYSRLE